MFSFAVEATVSLVLMFTFKVASDLWGAVGFGAWALARRILAFALPLATLGVEISLPRYIALHSERNPREYLLASVLLVLLGAAAMLLLFSAAPSIVTKVLFGDVALRALLLPLWCMLVSYSVHVLAFAYLRGRLHVPEANLLYLWAFGIVPLLVFTCDPASPEVAMWMIAGLVVIPALGVVVVSFVQRPVALSSSIALVTTFARYGAPRMLSALGLTTLALMPPLIVANQHGLAAAGAVALGVTLIGFAGTGMAPIALILLPVAARNTGKGDLMALRRGVKLLAIVALPFVCLVALAVWLVAPWAGALFAGSQQLVATEALRIAGFAAGPYALFVVLRPVLDAVTEKGRTFHATLFAIAAFASLWSVSQWLHPTEQTGIRLVMECYAVSMIVLLVSAYTFLHLGVLSALIEAPKKI